MLGNSLKRLNEPNIITLFVGIFLGILCGSLPIAFPGMPTPVKLGLAGGPLVVAILIGRFGHKLHLVTYTTQSANLMIREIGIVLFLASVGIEAVRTRNLRGEYWGGNGFYGYQVHPHNKKRLIVDEQVRDIIVMIFESCVAGMTTSEIAQMLNDMGIPSPLEHKRRNGGFYNGVVKEETGIWLKGAVRKILTDERYTGKMITNTRETEEVGKPKMRSLPRDQWVIVPGTHEAIISEELFRTAQNALQGRIRNVNKNTAGNRANNLFVCGCCGRKLRKNPAKEPHLVCPKNDSIKGAECAGLFVNQTQIEQAVLQMLREQSRSFLEQHCLMQACIDKKLSSIQTELDANTNMTRRLQSRKAELYEHTSSTLVGRIIC